MTNGTENDLTLQQRFAEVFARLPEQDIEQFYAHYQLWLLRRRMPTLEGQITALQAHIEENQRLIQSLQPSAVALAVLARLQSNGVSDVVVLDQMLERGEDWLDRMMQRLDYCEQVEDFIQGDYTQWCVNSLEGAYDWIDTMLGSAKETEQARDPESAATEAEDQATEELLLRKLRQEEEEEMPDATPAAIDEQAQVEVEAEAEPKEIPLQVAEQILMAGTGEREETGESASDSEIQQSPALLATWTDLEAPPERPAPWYSVNLAEEASAEAVHPEDMNDWIEVLQADTAHTLALKDTAATAADSSEVARPESAGTETAETGEEEQTVQQPESISGEQEPETTLANAEPQVAEEALEAPGELLTAEQSEIESNEILPSADENIVVPETGTAETPVSTEEETPSANVRKIVESELTEDFTPPTLPQEEQMPETETASSTEPDESTAGEADEANTAELNSEDEERTILAANTGTTTAYQISQKTSEETEASQEAQAAMQEPASFAHNAPDLASDVASQDDDATLPMALREIQRAREAQLQAEAATELAQNEPESASEGAAPAEVAESNEPAKIEITAPIDVEESEAETPTAIEQPGEPLTQEASEPAPSVQDTPVAQSAPESPIPARQPELQQPRSAEPPKRRGFWQRLFGWMRRK